MPCGAISAPRLPLPLPQIYRKALSLSPAARQKTSTGQIINMFSTDTKQLQMFLNFMNNVALAPLQIIVALALIWLQVGSAPLPPYRLRPRPHVISGCRSPPSDPSPWCPALVPRYRSTTRRWWGSDSCSS